MARTLTDGERELVAELTAEATPDAWEWYEMHADCATDPCAVCAGIEALDAATYLVLIDEAKAEYERDWRPDPGSDELPF
jgi:hypothetical protein